MMDLYAALGLNADATPAQIKAAYRRLVKTNHPDAGGSDEAFQKLTEAYEILSDPEARAAYDRGDMVETSRIGALRRHALGEIAAHVNNMMQQVSACEGEPHYAEDLVAALRQNLQNKIEAIEDAKKKIVRNTLRLELFAKRFHAPKGKDNVIERMVEARVSAMARQMTEKAEADLQVAKLALEIMQDYSFDMDEEDVPMAFVPLSINRTFRQSF